MGQVPYANTWGVPLYLDTIFTTALNFYSGLFQGFHRPAGFRLCRIRHCRIAGVAAFSPGCKTVNNNGTGNRR
jgi:hypothetical protein